MTTGLPAPPFSVTACDQDGRAVRGKNQVAEVARLTAAMWSANLPGHEKNPLAALGVAQNAGYIHLYTGDGRSPRS